ncbi:hypothetical protein SFRURICE_009772 [Spodoptera frugiperda]|nr:hypothetical protein SFRURICE_009772 [Spodoptera frugiperda]
MFRTRTITRALWHQQTQIRTHYARPCASILHISKPNTRNLNTVTVEDSYVKKFMNAVGWMDQSRTRLKLTGYFLYECIPENVSYAEWFESLELPDTFASWFVITELHVWMLMVRYMAEDILLPVNEKKKYIKGDGHFVRNCIIEALWADVANKIKLLEVAELDKIPSEDLRSKPKISWLSILDH